MPLRRVKWEQIKTEFAKLPASGGGEDEAVQILEDFARKYPDQRT